MNIYNASSIEVLKGLEAVRKNPGMYIGDVSTESGIMQMFCEIIDNSIDEVLAGFCNNIQITLCLDKSIVILDNGRGIPIDMHELGKPACEIIMCTLHSGAKFSKKDYNISGGLHGVGLSVVNALSEKLFLSIYRDGYLYYQEYSKGIPLFELVKKDSEDKKYTGTKIKFKPDSSIFSFLEFNYFNLCEKIKEKCFLNPNLCISILDESSGNSKKYCYKNGIVEFINENESGKILLNSNPILIKDFKKINVNENFSLEIYIQWNTGFSEEVFCYTNSIRNIDGGSHYLGFKAGIVKAINYYLNDNSKSKNDKYNLTYEDLKEGLYSFIVVKLSNPIFNSQTKNKLVSSNIKTLIEKCVFDNLLNWFYKNSFEAKNICKKIIESFKIKINSKKKKELNKIKFDFDKLSLASKLSDCLEKNIINKELFIVEGDSAGGSAKNARNRNFQAVLPLRGKIINVEKKNIHKILSNKEILSIISTIGTGIEGKNFDVSRLKYNKIILMTDADADGLHIRTLLLTFFYRKMRKIIENGNLFIAQSPLYRYVSSFKKKDYYFNNFSTLNFFLLNRYLNKYTIISLKKNSFLKTKIDYYNLFVNYKSTLFFFLNFIDITILDILIRKFNINFFKKKFINFDFINFYLNKNKYLFSLKITQICFYLEFDILCLKYCKNGIFLNFIFREDNFLNFDKLILLNFINLEFFFLEVFYKKNKEKNRIIKKKIFIFFKKLKKKYFKNITIQRYKGLGEMNADQLWETTMDPKNRILLKVKIDNFSETDKVFSDLMGDVSLIRKNCIHEYSFNNENREN